MSDAIFDEFECIDHDDFLNANIDREADLRQSYLEDWAQKCGGGIPGCS